MSVIHVVPDGGLLDHNTQTASSCWCLPTIVPDDELEIVNHSNPGWALPVLPDSVSLPESDAGDEDEAKE